MSMKIITMSFDDGTVYDEKLLQLLNARNIPCTFFLNSGKTSKEYLTPYGFYQGHEIGAHTVNHPRLVDLTFQEIYEDRLAWERTTGDVYGFAYPYGDYNSHAVEMVKKAGLSYGRTVSWQPTGFDFPDDPFVWQPTCHYSFAIQAAKDFAASKTANLFCIWGHSYEMGGLMPYDSQANWAYVEEMLNALMTIDAQFMTCAEVIRHASKD